MRKIVKAATAPIQQELQEEETIMLARARSKRLKTTSVIEPKRRRLLSVSDMTSTSRSKKNPRDIATTTELVNCKVCKNDDKQEMLLNCKGQDNRNCSIKVHLSCLKRTIENFGDNEEQSWQCNNCQSCVVCKNGAEQDNHLLKCYKCFKCYHAECYEARIQMVKDNRFCCESCEKATKPKAPRRTGRKKTVVSYDRTAVRRKTVVEKNVVQEKVVMDERVSRRSTMSSPPIITNNDTSSSEAEDFLGFNASEVQVLPVTLRPNVPVSSRCRSRSKSMDNPVQISDDSDENCDNIVDVNNIPDASNWSTEEVHEYFEKLFPHQAHGFRDQEINGTALYQLTREILIEKFGIKIGPALNIYAHLLKIQEKLKMN